MGVPGLTSFCLRISTQHQWAATGEPWLRCAAPWALCHGAFSEEDSAYPASEYVCINQQAAAGLLLRAYPLTWSRAQECIQYVCIDRSIVPFGSNSALDSAQLLSEGTSAWEPFPRDHNPTSSESDLGLRFRCCLAVAGPEMAVQGHQVITPGTSMGGSSLLPASSVSGEHCHSLPMLPNHLSWAPSQGLATARFRIHSRTVFFQNNTVQSWIQYRSVRSTIILTWKPGLRTSA